MNAEPLRSGSTTVQQTGQEAELGHFSTYSIFSLGKRDHRQVRRLAGKTHKITNFAHTLALQISHIISQ
jgi:hypothetical protein